jgi:hypothetical protein
MIALRPPAELWWRRLRFASGVGVAGYAALLLVLPDEKVWGQAALLLGSHACGHYCDGLLFTLRFYALVFFGRGLDLWRRGAR